MKRELGQYYTNTNIFNHELFNLWLNMVGTKIIIEPFAGTCNIPKLIGECKLDLEWSCFDIEKQNDTNGFDVHVKDTINNFPSNFDVAITNPPYLAKNSATRRKLPYPETKYDDLYKLCLDVMLSNCSYVAAIVPESFITSNLFHERLYGVISLNVKMFKDTECPVCLALFVPNKDNNDFVLYVGDEKIGMYEDIIKCDVENAPTDFKIKFNDKNGNIGVKCVDSQICADIYFHNGDDISPESIKISSRAFTRIGGLEWCDKEKLINMCNEILKKYREQTNDVFMTSFKGMRKDNRYRRRIDFKTLKNILYKAINMI